MMNFKTCPFRILFILTLFLPLQGWGFETKVINSPSKVLNLEIGETADGLQFRLSGPHSMLLTVEAYGFKTGSGFIPSGNKVSEVKTRKVSQHWSPVTGERREIPDCYREAIITLGGEKGKAGVIQVICRVYDEGIAFRYRFPENQAKGTIIERELTSFRPEGNFEAWTSLRAQSPIEKTTLDRITQEVERPLLVKQNNSSWLALGEAALTSFARMKFLTDAARPGCLMSRLSGDVNLDQAGLLSPWRYVMVADSPGKLLENNYFILNLNEPCQIADVFWIKPGKVIREVTLTTQGGLACVDFASRHGIEYVEFDAGWYGPENDPNSDATSVHVDPKRSTGPLDLQRVIGYAKEKNVGIILYVNHLALERQLDTILPLYQSWGVKGVKYGFVNVGSQNWTAWLHEAVRKAARYRLMVDIHDEYRPTGFSRTFPNLMTQEGIRGDEESPSTEHSLNTLFTRMIAGAGDNTNCFFAQRVSKTMGGKTAQMAKAIMIYSPWQFVFWYDRPEGSPARTGGAGSNEDFIRESPELAFYNTLPTVWDDTRVLEGEPGRFATIARRSGNSWFIGSLAAGQERSVKIPLVFLKPETTFEAVIYIQNEESLKNNQVIIKRMTVNSSTVISEILPANSGLAIVIKQNTLKKKVLSTPGCVALWDFSEKTGKPRIASGLGRFPLTERNGKVPRIPEGPLSGYSIRLDGSKYLSLNNNSTRALNIYGRNQGVSVMAWVKWSGEQTGFVAGMWNEYLDGGKRQYGLFVSLPYYNGKNQVCGHISLTGKPTPPFPYSVDYSASKQVVPENQWCCIAFTYDGKEIRSYLDGEFEPREPELINNTRGKPGYPEGLTQSKNPYWFPDGMGNNGSDFTVGAVLLKKGMGNLFKGQIGGVAVFNRALSESDLKSISTW